MEIEADVEIFELKQEISSLQAKLEEIGGKWEIFLIHSSLDNEISKIEDSSQDFKKVVGKGWRNSVMQRRIYGRLVSTG